MPLILIWRKWPRVRVGASVEGGGAGGEGGVEIRAGVGGGAGCEVGGVVEIEGGVGAAVGGVGVG